MGAKNNDETIKYSVELSISVDGVMSESDIVGALFGQTEGLLDSEMDLKQLQKSGRIGRIQLKLSVKSGKTKGKIILPSSLNKIETAVIAATLESVDRVGPCDCTIELEEVKDVRAHKRDLIAKRASEIMAKWERDHKQTTADIPALVEKDRKRGRVISFGPDSLPAGPSIYESQELILVEGRADVINLMKMDINNTIAINGAHIPATIKNLSKNREITALLDGDRGGDMILKELALAGLVEYVARAPYKLEVEDLSYKQVQRALEERVPIHDAEFLTEDQVIDKFLTKDQKSKSKKAPQQAQISKSARSSNGFSKSRRDRTSASGRKDQRQGSTIRKARVIKKGSRSSHSEDRPRSADTREPRGSSRDDRRSSDDRRSRDRGRSRGQSDRRRYVKVPSAIKNLISNVKSTLTTIFVNKQHEEIVSVDSAKAVETLETTDGVETVIIDGVITQRLLNLAESKNVKLVAGAVVGEITDRPTNLEFTTFNRV